MAKSHFRQQAYEHVGVTCIDRVPHVTEIWFSNKQVDFVSITFHLYVMLFHYML